jgi:hypothetical protein
MYQFTEIISNVQGDLEIHDFEHGELGTMQPGFSLMDEGDVN